METIKKDGFNLVRQTDGPDLGYSPTSGVKIIEVDGKAFKSFDGSDTILPYEDCCTVFTPKHPRTHPTIAGVEKAERGTEWDEPIKRAVEGTKVTVIKAFSKGE